MYFRQILHSDLGCASYLIADGGEAVVVDPKWEIDEYLTLAEEAGARIVAVLETHDHADHVSGRARLQAAINDRGAPTPVLGEGQAVQIGRAELVALATPGHRPEHVSYLVYESGTPRRLLSGDSLLIGDVARPDLAVDAQTGARDLWRSLRRLVDLEDGVEVWPAHVGGSLCASASASADPSSTIGRERASNPRLSHRDVEAFAQEITRCPPARPPRVQRIVELNRLGAAYPGPVRELDAAALRRLLNDEVCLLDVRSADEFDAGHLTGAINLPASGRGLGTRAAWAAGRDPIVLIAPTPAAGTHAAELLRAAGVWELAGMTGADVGAWRAAGLSVRTGDVLAAGSLIPRLASRSVTLLDVRDPHEWDAGHVAGSRSLPLVALGDGSGAAELDAPLAVVCASGARAAFAASILRRRGHEPAWRVPGGVDALARCGAPMVGGAA